MYNDWYRPHSAASSAMCRQMSPCLVYVRFESTWWEMWRVRARMMSAPFQRRSMLFMKLAARPREALFVPLNTTAAKQLIEDVDVYDLLLHGVRSSMQRLEAGDTSLYRRLHPQ